MRPVFFRRRQVWLPTLWGWLVLLGLVAASGLIAARNVYRLLAPNDPEPGARLLVVEGWLDSTELDQAIAAFRSGKYEQVVTTGGPIEAWPELRGSSSYADLAARYLETHGLDHARVTPVPAPASAQDRTYLSAVMVRKWAAKRRLALRALDVFSAGAHARRSRMLYRMAFGPGVAVGILSARPQEYDMRHWWRSSAGAKSVLEELIGLAWTACCVHAPPAGSQEEMWGEPSPPVSR